MTALGPVPPKAAIDAGGVLAGWDMAYVTSLATMNAELAKQKFWPRDIKVERPGKPTLTATVNSIRLAADSRAVGGKIVLSIVLSNAKVLDGSADLASCTFTADARLELLTGKAPDSRVPDAGQAKCPFLLKKLTGNSSVRLRDPDDPDEGRLFQLAAIQDPLQAWLDTELMDFAVEFAASLPGLETIAKGALGWALPAGIAYAVAIPTKEDGNLPGEDQCLFALLGSSDLDRMARLQPQVLPEALPTGVEASYVLSARLLLSTMIGPSLLCAIRATNAPRLDITDREMGLTNFDTIKLPDLDLSSDQKTSIFVQTGSNVQIAPGDLHIRIDGDQLIVNQFRMAFTTAAECEAITLAFNYSTGLETASDGTIRLRQPTKYNGSAIIELTDKAFEIQRWTGVVVAIVTALLAVVPGIGEAGSTAAEPVEVGAGAAARTLSTTAATEVAELGSTEVGQIAAQAEKELVASAAAPALSGFASAFAKKAALVVGIALAQSFICDGPGLLKHYQDLRKAGDIDNWRPSLDEIAQAISGTAWFGSLGAKARCTGAEFNDGLILHLAFGAARP